MKDPTRTLPFWSIWNMSFGFLGIQFGWGLQMANMSAIYQYLGADDSQLPYLWLAAPVTGLLIQPIIGHYSDRTWTRLGRRRPYFLVGAILASLALLVMPNCTSVWMAAGALWLLDGSVNVSMEPFRAFIGDLVPKHQRKVGFAVQSFFIGLGAVVSNLVPGWLHSLGISSTVVGRAIPETIRLSFYIGAGVYLACVLYTVVTTPEPPPDPDEVPHAEELGVLHIVTGILRMPPAMARLAATQFFTWLALFCMWIYFTPVVAVHFFGAVGTEGYARGTEWAQRCFGVENGVATVYAFVLIWLGQKGVSSKALYVFGLVSAGLGLLSVGILADYHWLLLSMGLVGIGWATILSMPYALLANNIPASQMGYFMGVFNFFIVLPQIVAGVVLGPIVKHLLNGSGLGILAAGGFFMLVAAGSLALVPSHDSAVAQPA